MMVSHQLGRQLRIWLRQLRVYQYVKNLLVFVPVITAHEFNADALRSSFLAAAAFSLCASAVYILNDWWDLQADRAHPTKQFRPLAAGKIKVRDALAAIPVLLTASAWIALSISGLFALIIAAYFVMTTAYTFVIKRKLIADVVLLAMLYTIRVIGGAVAIAVPISEWLLYFSIFVFASLALLKRTIELVDYAHLGKDPYPSRGYYASDVGTVTALAAASSMNAVTVFALYLSSSSAAGLYAHPKFLYLLCPIMIFWLFRLITLAQRKIIHDDPIVFAVKDRVSWITCLVTAVILLLASSKWTCDYAICAS
ncbi:UbiA family prenyltransferase [Hyphomicrobium facile]|uniref:4-hydroxybenzoate polyprenyltransferase n=1 Tax=Hyphomicrobium facile TaxID=51670 RepID=A0A1I7NFD3_9HYPH|nr:4-hydroxybenzoate polyprenyltransferase [Hyphomicrobium facile]